ncbi:MAG TPA: hypothetical protein VJS38_01695 [Phenylobacterium sp.]|uniref:hypothetical protein n=1 Tax=Phenylobacterium sp. TaxID=1871053 RepID=UPI002B47D9F6|nr:hypothetical protein [Phenylobacterium sp.]HKR86864.1 hypothetical protein [Phenylobacterium sp.]HKT52917.1 hypothetical protein [Caulobacteraceae bacterium]
MTPKLRVRPAAGLGAIVAAVSLAAAHAQAPAGATAVKSVTDVQQVSEKVTVVSVDPATRHLVVRKPSGETSSLKVPAEVRNFDQLKPGDTISATYTLEAEFALSPPNKPLPEDTQTVITARASRGELPAGVIANHLVVTGAVLGVDTQANTVRVVSPKGGEVHTFAVTSPEGRRLISQLKPGDKVTAYVTESILIAAQRG